MRLYLVRHGHALEGNIDARRPLSREGREEAAKAGAWLGRLNLEWTQVWHSGKTRAMETAQILCDCAGVHVETVERPGLAPGGAIEPVASELALRDTDLCIVSHLPFIPALASHLTANGPTHHPWAIVPCSVLCLERDGTGGGWWERWFVVPEILP